jgi:hypothetical protein
MNPDLGCSGVNDNILELFGLGEEGLNNAKRFLESFRGNPLHDMKETILFSSRLRSSSLLQILWAR